MATPLSTTVSHPILHGPKIDIFRCRVIIPCAVFVGRTVFGLNNDLKIALLLPVRCNTMFYTRKCMPLPRRPGHVYFQMEVETDEA